MRFARIMLTLLLVVALVGLTTGCPRTKTRAKKPFVRAPHRPERGPRGSPLAYWADNYLLEVCIDRAAKEATVYVLKGNNTEPEPIQTPALTLTLTNSDPPRGGPTAAGPSGGRPQGERKPFSGRRPCLRR